MKQRKLHRISLLIVLCVLLTFVGASFVICGEFNTYMKQSIKNEAGYIKHAIEDTKGAYLTQEIGDLTSSRITLADTDGTVLFDSEKNPENLGNHSDRPEFIEARKNGSSETVRFSETLSKQTFNYAVQLNNGMILRLSRTTGSPVFTLMLGFILLVFLLILILAFTFSLIQKKEAAMVRREFSANVSHELKTPLMSISGYAELIQSGIAREEDIPEFAGRIHHEAARLTNLVEDVIQLSRLDEGTESLPFEKVNLCELTADVCSHLELPSKKKRQTLVFHGEPAFLMGNRQILHEMFFNLTDNAIKYTPENGHITVSLTETSREITWTVTDTGIGIAEDEQERIFERFYRVDKSHSRLTGGTGLGLSIVKHGAALHKAKINVESQLGKGTSISLIFRKS